MESRPAMDSKPSESNEDQLPLRVEGLSKRFGEKTVFENVSFDVSAGELVAIIGESGSGKSVLLKQLIRLLRPTSGKIHLFGEDLWATRGEEELRQLKNRIGVLFQHGALFSALPVAENVGIPLREQTKLGSDFVRWIVELRLLMSGLELETARKMPSELSGGMVKRAALARALALEPELLFLDEPTSGLDPIHARAFDSLIRTLCDNLSLTVILVTHDLETVEGIADRVIILGGGSILADGDPREVAKVDHPWIREYFSSRPRQRHQDDRSEE